MFLDRINDELDTSTIDFFINNDMILFNELIPAEENLWKFQKTRKHITFTKQCNHYSDLVFDSVFYQNISVDTVGLIVTFKVTANDGLKLETSTEE